MSPKAVQKRASVAASTVEAVGRGDLAQPRRRRRGTTPDRVLATPVVSSRKVHPAVWERAMELAGGDAKRITVVHYHEVLVR